MLFLPVTPAFCQSSNLSYDLTCSSLHLELSLDVCMAGFSNQGLNLSIANSSLQGSLSWLLFLKKHYHSPSPFSDLGFIIRLMTIWHYIVYLFIYLSLYTHGGFFFIHCWRLFWEGSSPRISSSTVGGDGGGAQKLCGMNKCFTSSRFRMVFQVSKEKTIFRDRNSVGLKATLSQAVTGVEVISLGPFPVPSTERWPLVLHMLPGWWGEASCFGVKSKHKPLTPGLCSPLL